MKPIYTSVKLSLISICALAICSSILGCSSNTKKKSTGDTAITVELDKKNNTKFETTFSSPSPDEIITLFEDSGLKFKSNIINNPENINNYLSSTALNINLGVFVADAAYLNMFKQYAQLTSHLESIFKIVDKLELNSVYLEFDFKKFFREMDNPDSLIVLSEGIYHASVNYMVENDKQDELCMISYGSLIELLHLTLQSIDKFDADDVIIQQIYDQQMQLDNLIEYAQSFSGRQEIEVIITDLTQLKTILLKSSTTVSETQTQQSATGELVISGGTKYSVTTEQFNELKNLVNKIRTKITT